MTRHCPTVCKICNCHKPPRPGTAVCALAKRYSETLSFYIAAHHSDGRAHDLKRFCDEIVKEGLRDA